MDRLSILTFNVKGLKDDDKRNTVFHWLKKKKVDIICIQEAHCKKDTIKTWKEEWGAEIIPSFGSSNKKGTCILLSPDFRYKVITSKECENGRYVVFNFKAHNSVYKIAGYYGPNEDNPTYIAKI